MWLWTCNAEDCKGNCAWGPGNGTQPGGQVVNPGSGLCLDTGDGPSPTPAPHTCDPGGEARPRCRCCVVLVSSLLGFALSSLLGVAFWRRCVVAVSWLCCCIAAWLCRCIAASSLLGVGVTPYNVMSLPHGIDVGGTRGLRLVCDGRACVSLLPPCTGSPSVDLPFCDHTLPVAARVAVRVPWG